MNFNSFYYKILINTTIYITYYKKFDINFIILLKKQKKLNYKLDTNMKTKFYYT